MEYRAVKIHSMEIILFRGEIVSCGCPVIVSRTWQPRCSPGAPARRERGRQVPLTAELLEDRTTPATITPTTFADGIGIGSLRDAILQADGNGQSNYIALAPGTYQLSLAGRNESAGKTGDLNLTASGFTTIQGAGSGSTIINAAQIDRVFEVLSGVTLVLSDLTVTGGLATDGGTIGGSDALGGGILNDGNLSLNSVVVTGNTAEATPGDNTGAAASTPPAAYWPLTTVRLQAITPWPVTAPPARPGSTAAAAAMPREAVCMSAGAV